MEHWQALSKVISASQSFSDSRDLCGFDAILPRLAEVVAFDESRFAEWKNPCSLLYSVTLSDKVLLGNTLPEIGLG